MLVYAIKKRPPPRKNTRDGSELTCYHPISPVSHDGRPYQVRTGNDLSKLYRCNGRSRHSLTHSARYAARRPCSAGFASPILSTSSTMGFSVKAPTAYSFSSLPLKKEYHKRYDLSTNIHG